jgi:hypothetical protein
MTNSESRVWMRQAEDRKFIKAVMAMADDNDDTKAEYNADYILYINSLDDDDFQLSYDEWSAT